MTSSSSSDAINHNYKPCKFISATSRRGKRCNNDKCKTKNNNGHGKLKSGFSTCKFIDKSGMHLLHRKKKNIDCYSGDASVELYIANFKRMLKRNNVSRDERADELLDHLREQARELTMPNEQSKILTFKDMCSKLICCFAPVNEPSECVAHCARVFKKKERVFYHYNIGLR